MATFLDKQRAGEHLAWEIKLQMSRKTVTFTAGKIYKPGEVLAEVGGKAVSHDPDAGDGSENALYINHAEVDATAADKSGVVQYQLCLVKPDKLVWKDGASQGQIDTAVAALATKFINLEASIV